MIHERNTPEEEGGEEVCVQVVRFQLGSYLPTLRIDKHLLLKFFDSFPSPTHTQAGFSYLPTATPICNLLSPYFLTNRHCRFSLISINFSLSQALCFTGLFSQQTHPSSSPVLTILKLWKITTILEFYIQWNYLSITKSTWRHYKNKNRKSQPLAGPQGRKC